jgi:thiamine-phosphate pyrophosphorylase
MIRCYITDRYRLPAGLNLMDAIAHNLARGIDWIQIREKDLPSRELFQQVSQAVGAARTTGAKILVNSLVDVALAAGAAGVHLPSHSPAPQTWRAITPAGFLIGVSCHSVEEVRQAEAEGADYVMFGPVFAPLSKTSDLEPRGLEGLAAAARAVQIPVLALGGITESNTAACIGTGAAGYAGISRFQSF